MALYLGIDAGTQSIKAELIDSINSTIVESVSVNFGDELPEYHAENGFSPNVDTNIRQADPCMWLEALDKVLAKLQATNAPLDKIAGISGSGQQHGSVYLNNTFSDTLEKLGTFSDLKTALKSTFSRRLSPIWMDSSTSLECQELTAQFGEKIQINTGSGATERFTGPQIRKFAKDDKDGYNNTQVIHLVSSFLCSVLAGESMPIDIGDGAGMNLLNLKSLSWDSEICSFTAPNLLSKLPPVVKSDAVVGKLSSYFTKYGLKSGTPIVVFSGDNPNSLVGVGATLENMAVISLGTSDTFFAMMRDYKTDPDKCGHVFGSGADGFMSLICFKNGSLAREKVKELCGVDWNYFDNQACLETEVGNHGKLMLPYFESECTPVVLTAGAKYNFDPTQANNAEKIRAIFESQALSMKYHSLWQDAKFNRIRVTGGASKSLAFREILANVFQADVESIKVANSAALGAALRACNGVEHCGFKSLFDKFCQATSVVKFKPETKAIYDEQLKAFASFEKK